eukprot:CAMPEP_0179221564 /NCGR_PEP_ID=MMETSP0797-20121207/6263_1 /TAXON_ID=47934 /ORGANISM="Dinophysis acuminata, Strain DAEP01" /LENGTH=142 /DNA_ID=CAMNT_0020928365 /DNA_START=75 /DNA_END=500 /DNA_ORIENTATION=-
MKSVPGLHSIFGEHTPHSEQVEVKSPKRCNLNDIFGESAKQPVTDIPRACDAPSLAPSLASFVGVYEDQLLLLRTIAADAVARDRAASDDAGRTSSRRSPGQGAARPPAPGGHSAAAAKKASTKLGDIFGPNPFEYDAAPPR